ncbi:MAG: Peptidoglycan glycosyltransferase [Candidatus Azambacteria bacterium GW2011_GWA2_42_9]|uniref:Peptidoglycan glycosyltransferase n=2 Tax=Candidatus Azamiibacteriota TaxID=1752741 RepID=A0A0G0Z4H7_9BACT|nr:MAG: Peptidoglycan glycosyltransferase [Candidatus Azambacteria bacterium GW2011_GWB1_42_17]KKS75003.1 MAG: Peptidoglycan glycosyltransferase [Candidatus Azambacteria bacterium GW2011_GWA2_42_9]
MLKQGIENRILILILIFVAVGLIVWGRFFYLTVVRHDYYLAKIKNAGGSDIIAPRGSIFLTDKDNLPFAAALNKEFPLVYAVPSKIKDPASLAKKLAPILEIDEAALFAKLNKTNDPYEILKKKVPDEIIGKIKSDKDEGVFIDNETLRYYPEGLYLGEVIGFLGFNKSGQKGQYGLEESYEEELSGIVSSADLILTVDSSIQAEAGNLLAKLAEQWRADNGSIVVMNPKNGAILAMASFPDFDANKYSEVENKNVFINPVTLKRYEPGSVFKPITMAIGIETGAVSPETQYYNTGTAQIGGRIISNSIPDKILGWQSMTMVLEQSLNTGAIFVEQKVPKDIFLKYLKDFGIDGKTEIDVSEVAGDLSALSSGRDINFATASFGQGVAVTPIGLLRALSVIAGGGKLVKPHLVSKIVWRNGDFKNQETDDFKQIISPETAAKLTSMMIKVVENGSGRRAQVKGYTIAGKTGTAQVPDLKNGGYKDEYIHTFAAFAPAYDPKFIALIKLDNPKGVRFAESTVVAPFKELAEFIFSYYQIPPDKPETAQ